MPQDRQGITATLSAPKVVGGFGLQVVGEEVKDTSLILPDGTEAIESLPNTLPSHLEDIIHKIGNFTTPLNLTQFTQSFDYRIGFYDKKANNTIVPEGVEKKVKKGSIYTLYEFPFSDAEPFIIVDQSLADKVFFYHVPVNHTYKLIGLNNQIAGMEKYAVKVISSEKEYWRYLLNQEKKKTDAKAAVESFDDLVANARHELVNHAMPLEGYLQLGVTGELVLTPEICETMLPHARNILSIIEQLKIGNHSPYRTRSSDKCDIRGVLNTVMANTDMLKERYRKKDVIVEYDIRADTSNQVRASEVNMLAILYNLISNAIKYTDKGTIKIRVSAADTNYAIEVSDTGIGIPSSIDPFAQYSRADNVGSREGSGLGLAIVKQIVDGYDGRISYTSKLGVGTTFRVELPLAISR